MDESTQMKSRSFFFSWYRECQVGPSKVCPPAGTFPPHPRGLVYVPPPVSPTPSLDKIPECLTFAICHLPAVRALAFPFSVRFAVARSSADSGDKSRPRRERERVEANIPLVYLPSRHCMYVFLFRLFALQTWVCQRGVILRNNRRRPTSNLASPDYRCATAELLYIPSLFSQVYAPTDRYRQNLSRVMPHSGFICRPLTKPEVTRPLASCFPLLLSLSVHPTIASWTSGLMVKYTGLD